MKLAFFVRSAEIVPCPCCGGSLKVVGSRRRVWYKSSSEKTKLIIRRMYCERCERIHHELPDILVPYKRYDADSIEQVVSESGPIDIVVDDSTIFRWRRWFSGWSSYAQGCLQSITIRFHLPVDEDSSDHLQTVLHPIGRFVGHEVGWLSRAVRSIANLNFWVQTRSAFLSEFY
jgi:hypothetical protein